ncbi:MAG: hypothetical protein M3R17_10470 [Bacteroidota bacterium]|nr:hypothetical protein [Bacteroidota bacterium]
MLTYRRSLLPLFAFLFSISAMFYSACHESKADQKNSSGVSGELTEEVSIFEKKLAELKTIHANHIKTYSDEMGCVKDSKALDIVNRHKALLDKNSDRQNYHKMQLIQADTTNIERNDKQLEELKKDLIQLQADGEEIKNGFNNFSPAHITK